MKDSEIDRILLYGSIEEQRAMFIKGITYLTPVREQVYGHTFRSPGRDTWPVALADLAAEFQRLWDDRAHLGLGCHTFFDANNKRRVERGGHPLKEKRDRGDICRVCTL